MTSKGRKGSLIWLAIAACVVVTFLSGIKVDMMLMKLENEVGQKKIQQTKVSSRTRYRAVAMASSSPSSSLIPNATIVVQLSGEMGNNLHKIAFARGLQIQAMERDVSTNLILRHDVGDDSKWRRARSLISRCFPKSESPGFRSR